MIEPTSKGIDFVNKDNASIWAFPGILEELSDSLWANPSEYLLELRRDYFDETTPGLIG